MVLTSPEHSVTRCQCHKHSQKFIYGHFIRIFVKYNTRSLEVRKKKMMENTKIRPKWMQNENTNVYRSDVSPSPMRKRFQTAGGPTRGTTLPSYMRPQSTSGQASGQRTTRAHTLPSRAQTVQVLLILV